MTKIEAALKKEIENSGVDVDTLQDFIWGGKEEIDLNKKIYDIVGDNSTTQFRTHFYNYDRPQGFFNNMRRIRHINDMADQGLLPKVDMENYGSFSIPMNTLYPTSVHHGMFESIVKVLGSDDQIEKHWDDILHYRIIG
jgi:hypothetical protein